MTHTQKAPSSPWMETELFIRLCELKREKACLPCYVVWQHWIQSERCSCSQSYVTVEIKT